MLCDNAVADEQGVNTEKYVPNPRHTSPLAVSMFEFVGKLIGIVLRHKFYLPFELAPLVCAAAADRTLHSAAIACRHRAVETAVHRAAVLTRIAACRVDCLSRD